MELWLLVGALVLIALTVWIVWTPQRARDAEDSSMNEPTSAKPTFEATSTVTEVPEPARASEAWSAPGLAREGTATQPWSAAGTTNFDSATESHGMSLTEPRTIGMGAGALLAVGSGVAGAWLYSRWQHERNKPINRIRRGARDLASQLVDRADDLPERSGPIGGGAAALLISSLVLARALRRDDTSLEARTRRSGDMAQELALEAIEEARRQSKRMRSSDLNSALDEVLKQARRLRASDVSGTLEDAGKYAKQARQEMRRQARSMPSNIEISKDQTMLGGIGLGGVALVAGIGYVIWRLFQGGSHTNDTYYVGDKVSS